MGGGARLCCETCLSVLSLAGSHSPAPACHSNDDDALPGNILIEICDDKDNSDDDDDDGVITK